MEAVITVIEGMLCLCLAYTYYYISKKGTATNIDKGIVTLLSVLILALSDKFKLLFWGAAVGIIYLIKLIISKNKETHGRSA